MIYAYFYQIEYSEKCCFYKRNFLNQLIKLVDISEKLERCYEIEKADIIFTIADFVNDIELINKKLIVYSLQDNSFSNQSIIENKNVLFVLDHCKACNDTIKNLQGEFVLDHFMANEEYNKKVLCYLNISELYKNKYQSEVLPLSNRKYDVVFMGTTQYNEKITKHRMDVIQHIEDVCRKNNLYCYTSTTPIKYSKYINILNNTKIFISPYGWGEFSLKEYECICYGAHIVKPKIYFQYYPNYCENMDDFEIDLSNFESKILDILANLDDAQKKVDSNRKMFLDFCVNKHLAEFENKIIEILNSE
jgi:hypothetical protein